MIRFNTGQKPPRMPHDARESTVNPRYRWLPGQPASTATSAATRATPTTHPIACVELRPSDNSDAPAVHAEVFMLYVNRVNQSVFCLFHVLVESHPQMTQYPAKPCQVHVLRSSGIGIRSRLHQKVFR
ncbi:hypothetical protein PG996_007242 [Apiospora saccharicola]|uniref:Uncharacterized protein n=1 Tax=Apiospora saccharicola TaxID=335842 RepID=A0ABR1VA88_9PEZI